MGETVELRFMLLLFSLCLSTKRRLDDFAHRLLSSRRVAFACIEQTGPEPFEFPQLIRMRSVVVVTVCLEVPFSLSTQPCCRNSLSLSIHCCCYDAFNLNHARMFICRESCQGLNFFFFFVNGTS